MNARDWAILHSAGGKLEITLESTNTKEMKILLQKDFAQPC